MAIKYTNKTAGKGVLNLNLDALQNLGVVTETDKEGNVTEYDFGEMLARYANSGDTVSFSFAVDEEVLPTGLFLEKEEE